MACRVVRRVRAMCMVHASTGSARLGRFRNGTPPLQDRIVRLRVGMDLDFAFPQRGRRLRRVEARRVRQPAGRLRCPSSTDRRGDERRNHGHNGRSGKETTISNLVTHARRKAVDGTHSATRDSGARRAFRLLPTYDDARMRAPRTCENVLRLSRTSWIAEFHSASG